MATTISKLAILLSLNSQGVTSGVVDATKRIDAFDKRIGNLGKNSFAQLGRSAENALSGMAARFTGAIGSAVAFERVISGIADAYERVNQRSKRASQLGASTQELGALEFAFGRATQINADGTFDALRAFNKRISDAKDPANELAKALDRIGLSAQRLEKLSITDRVRTIGEAIRQLPAAEDRAAVAAKFFEETGSNVVALFNEGDAALVALLKDYEHLHGVLAATDVERMEQASQEMGRLWIAIEGSFERLAAELGPHLADEFARITESVIAMREGIVGVGETFNSWKGFIKDVGSILTLVQGPQGWGWHYLWAQTDFMAPSEMRQASPDRAERAAKQIERLGEASNKAADDMERVQNELRAQWERGEQAGESLRQSLRTPAEVFREDADRFWDMLSAGFIDRGTYDRAISDAQEKLDAATRRTEQVAKRDLSEMQVGLVERRSVGAFSAERAGKTELAKLVANSDKALGYDEKIAAQLEEQTRLWREKGEIILEFQPIL